MNSDNPNWFDEIEGRPHPWPGLNWLTTAIACPNVRDAIAFYVGAMKFAAIFELPGEDGELLFARMRYRGCNFTLNRYGFDFETHSPSTTGQPPPFVFYLYVDNVADMAQSMIAAGATCVFEARKEFWGDIRARIKDPLGYIWDLAQAPSRTP